MSEEEVTREQAVRIVTVEALRWMADKANERADRERSCRPCITPMLHQIRAGLLDELADEYRTRALHILNGAP